MTYLRTLDELRTLYGPPRERAVWKEWPALDAHATRLVGLSPLVVLASGSDDGAGGGWSLDASPRGGAPGFVRVADAHTLLIPDAPGNRRLDTLENLMRAGAGEPHGAPLGLLFLVPGLDETLRVNGRARLSVDEAERQACADERRTPALVIRVAVQAAYLHCAKALMRARLWDPARHIERAALPTMGEMLRDQILARHGRAIEAESQAQMLARYRDEL